MAPACNGEQRSRRTGGTGWRGLPLAGSENRLWSNSRLAITCPVVKFDTLTAMAELPVAGAARPERADAARQPEAGARRGAASCSPSAACAQVTIERGGRERPASPRARSSTASATGPGLADGAGRRGRAQPAGADPARPAAAGAGCRRSASGSTRSLARWPRSPSEHYELLHAEVDYGGADRPLPDRRLPGVAAARRSCCSRSSSPWTATARCAPTWCSRPLAADLIRHRRRELGVPRRADQARARAGGARARRRPPLTRHSPYRP